MDRKRTPAGFGAHSIPYGDDSSKARNALELLLGRISFLMELLLFGPRWSRERPGTPVNRCDSDRVRKQQAGADHATGRRQIRMGYC